MCGHELRYLRKVAISHRECPHFSEYHIDMLYTVSFVFLWILFATLRQVSFCVNLTSTPYSLLEHRGKFAAQVQD